MSSNSKIILITGTSSGFGLLTAARLASHGHHVIATMRNIEKRHALLREVNRRGGKVIIKTLDVTKKETIKQTMNEVASQFGYLDCLVNNAGYAIGGFFEDLTDEEIRQQMEVNFFGVQNVTRAAIPLMRSRKSGKIINISSIAGFSTSPAFSAYDVSKWALEAFSESLRYELKLFGIDVLLIEPGTYNTKIFHENAKYAKNFDNKDSPYYLISQKLRKFVLDYVNDCHKDPEEIPILIEKLIHTKNPSFRNIPDLESQTLAFFRKLLPFSMYSFIVNSTFLTKLAKTNLK